jgi:hypothetical protein
MTEPPNHPAKAVVEVVLLGAGVGLLVFGIVHGRIATAVVGALVAAGSVLTLTFIAIGRNPRWMQGPLDRLAAERAGITPPASIPTARRRLTLLAASFVIGSVAALVGSPSWVPVLAILCGAWVTVVARRRDA